MATAEGNITTNTNNITNLQTRIDTIVPAISHEGLYTLSSSSGNIILTYNYNLGSFIFWANTIIDGASYITAINNYDTQNNIRINAETSSLILPGIIKNSSGSVYKNLAYTIDETSSNRVALNNLSTITILPGVYSIDFNLKGAPNLMYINMFEGLKRLYIEGTGSSMTNSLSLTIPSSVDECYLEKVKFNELIFINSANYLKLTYKDVQIINKFVCNRLLTNNSSITMPDIETDMPFIMETSLYFLNLLSNTVNSGKNKTQKTTLILVQNLQDVESLSYNVEFLKIYNMSSRSQPITNLSAQTWIG